MIYLYTGTPGSGKSYHAAEVVDRALRRKVPVIANFQVNLNPKKHKGEFVYIPTLGTLRQPQAGRTSGRYHHRRSADTF